MNKQHLAARIWRCANNMRGKISAEKYKNYILGFIFYKYVSEKEEDLLISDGWRAEDIEALSEGDIKDADYIRERIGYFIPYKYLYSTWIRPDADFNVGDVRDALQSFNRNVYKDYRAVYDNVFASLVSELDDLGDNPQHQLVAIKKLLDIIQPIPMDSRDYDVLGFIYENLIGNFAANAGKKAGEFYTPREVAVLMSDIIAYNLQDKNHISIYDPTSGSASLLLTVGQSVAKHNGNPDSVKYYAQELIKETYNLTRMNLIMRGIKPANIVTKNADTLIDDWPLQENEVDPLRVDACCSNPPYSKEWVVPTASDPRFDEYGRAPKSKADYAFLLHNLYHLNAGGIMTIVLPHGVLFRGGEESKIRTKLLENGNIEAIIGLPPDIFYGTQIPTIVMVLRRSRSKRDVLFIDASKYFIRDGTKNRLREQDIRRVFDAYCRRTEIDGFSHVATWEEIEENGFNLNIPRYVDSSEKTSAPDIYASMFGGVPVVEIDELSIWWKTMPSLRGELFSENGSYATLKVKDIDKTIGESQDVVDFKTAVSNAAAKYIGSLCEVLFGNNLEELDIRSVQQELEARLFSEFSVLPLVDEYAAYQEFSDSWKTIANDLETIKADGFTTASQAIDPNLVVEKQKDKREEEVQDKNEPWVGRVLPFGIVQRLYLPGEFEKVERLEATIAQQDWICSDFVNNLTEEEQDLDFIKEDGSIDVSKSNRVNRAFWEACSEYEPQLEGLICYWDTLKDKNKGIVDLKSIPAYYQGTDWGAIKAKQDGTYTTKAIETRITNLIDSLEFNEESLAARLKDVIEAIKELKCANKELKIVRQELIDSTRTYIENISIDEAKSVLKIKWTQTLEGRLAELADERIADLKTKVCQLAKCYEETLKDVDDAIEVASTELVGMLEQLEGNDFDMAGIAEFRRLLGGE